MRKLVILYVGRLCLYPKMPKQTAQRRVAAKSNFVSSEVVVNPNAQLGFSKAFMVRDPDGRAVEIEQK